MKDVDKLSDEERAEVFRLLKPIGYREGDELHHCEIRDGVPKDITDKVKPTIKD